MAARIRSAPALQPAHRVAAAALPVVLRDQGGEFERFAESDDADLADGRFGDEQVAALERTEEDGSRVALRCQSGAPFRAGQPADPNENAGCA